MIRGTDTLLYNIYSKQTATNATLSTLQYMIHRLNLIRLTPDKYKNELGSVYTTATNALISKNYLDYTR